MSAAVAQFKLVSVRMGGLLRLAQAVLVLNLLDAVLTLLWVQLGVADEANVLLRGLVHSNAVAFMAVKLSLVSAGLWVLWRERDRPLAVFGVVLAFLTYGSLLFVHMRVAATAAHFVS